MRLGDLFKDVVLCETARTVWNRRGDKLTKQIIRQHELKDVKPRVRFDNTEVKKENA